MSLAPLTRRQNEILTYLTNYVSEHGYGPSLQEIGDALGMSSPARVESASPRRDRRRDGLLSDVRAEVGDVAAGGELVRRVIDSVLVNLILAVVTAFLLGIVIGRSWR